MEWNHLGLLMSNRHTYTYTDFEKYCHESITPSMYHYMASYVLQNHQHEPNIEMAAVNAYFNLPETLRIDMHDQELMNLNWQRERTALLLDTVNDEYEEHVLTEEWAHYTKEIYEEEQWHI